MNAADTLVAFGMAILMFVCSQLIRQPTTLVSQRDADGKRVLSVQRAIALVVELPANNSNLRRQGDLHEEANE